MIAVGGLLPLPVILLYGFSGGVVLVFSLVHVVVYTWVFYLAARRVDSLVRRGRVRGSVAGAIVFASLLALSVAPIYGSGENLAAGGKLTRNAYEVYRDAVVQVRRG